MRKEEKKNITKASEHKPATKSNKCFFWYFEDKETKD